MPTSHRYFYEVANRDSFLHAMKIVVAILFVELYRIDSSETFENLAFRFFLSFIIYSFSNTNVFFKKNQDCKILRLFELLNFCFIFKSTSDILSICIRRTAAFDDRVARAEGSAHCLRLTVWPR